MTSLHRPKSPGACLLLLAGIALGFGGCRTFLRDTPTPLPTRTWSTAAPASGRTLVVFLPGRGGSVDDFEKHGMVAVLREAGIDVDVVAVDAHLNYYYKRTVIERLRADVIEPARERGYGRIVVVGVSLGGLGALLYERDVPGMVNAIVLLAPYLGDQDHLFDDIAAAGGARPWAAGRDSAQGGIEEQLWTFLGKESSRLPPTWLLAGRGDWLARGHGLLATLVTPERIRLISGGHDWRTWRALWRDVCLNSTLFAEEKVTVGNPPPDTIPSPRN